MEKVDYIDVLFHEISKAKTRERLLYLEDDIGIAIGLGQIPNRQDIRFLKLALQNRYSYTIFKEILEELNDRIDPDSNFSVKNSYEQKMEKIEKRHLVLLDNLKQ